MGSSVGVLRNVIEFKSVLAIDVSYNIYLGTKDGKGGRGEV